MIDLMHEFSLFMNPAQIGELLQHRLPACQNGKWDILDCEIDNPRYKTYLREESRYKSFLSLVYRLFVRNHVTQKNETKILFARAFLGDRSHAAYDKAKQSLGFKKEFAVLHFADLGLVGHLFPYDPALPRLSELTNTKFLGRYFSSAKWLESFCPSKTIKNIQFEVVNYRPEVRCTNRYIIDDVAGKTFTLYGKTYSEDDGSEIFRRMHELWCKSNQNPNSFVVPKPLEYDGLRNTLWLEGLYGTPITNLLTKANANTLLNKIMLGLINLHQAKISGLPVIDSRQQIQEVQKKSMKLIGAFPEFENSLNRIVSILSDDHSGSVDELCLIHCDFHIHQMLQLPDKRLALFDYDELAIGNPLQDVVNFSIDLFNQNYDHKILIQLIANVFDCYQKQTGRTIPLMQLDWHWRLQCLTRAYRAYIQQKPQLKEVVKQFLSLAESGVDEIFKGPAINKTGKIYER